MFPRKTMVSVQIRSGNNNHKNKSDLGPNFIAPDGGWAWMVCIAAGVSNLSIYPCLQQFGFMFRERMSFLGMSNSQVTTIINSSPAISACTGLLNGPMFRKLTYRQVAIIGAIFIFSGIFLTAFCETFIDYMLAYALLYGFGMGISISASSLAINTYFKKKRRLASGFSWTITGLGPIFLPHFVTYLLSVYGVQGTVLVFAALSLHTFACGLTYQPVQFHVLDTKDENRVGKEKLSKLNPRCQFCNVSLKCDENIFTRTFLHEPTTLKGQNIDVTTPDSSSKQLKMNTFLETNESKIQKLCVEDQIKECYTCLKEKLIFEIVNDEHNIELNINEKISKKKRDQNLSFIRRAFIFFDLDLLQDFTYVNLVAGLTIINFGELNFSILTPFILADFGFDTSQTTLAISILAGLDITMRFIVPFLTEKISWDNRVFFLIGVVGIALGRSIVACTRSYSIILSSFVWIGICKGVRTVFWPLILPGYVPLKRLPGASGLQLLISGLFTFVAGPLVGLVRDRYDYSVTLHCLNMMSFLAAFAWTLEAIIRHQRKKHLSSI